MGPNVTGEAVTSSFNVGQKNQRARVAQCEHAQLTQRNTHIAITKMFDRIRSTRTCLSRTSTVLRAIACHGTAYLSRTPLSLHSSSSLVKSSSLSIREQHTSSEMASSDWIHRGLITYTLRSLSGTSHQRCVVTASPQFKGIFFAKDNGCLNVGNAAEVLTSFVYWEPPVNHSTFGASAWTTAILPCFGGRFASCSQNFQGVQTRAHTC